MNIIHKVTWQSMWKNKTRTIVTIISVILSAAMFMAGMTMVYSLWDYVVTSNVHEAGDFFVEFNYATDEQYEELKEDKSVSYVADFKMLGYHCFRYFRSGAKIHGFNDCPVGAVDEEFFEHMTIPLLEGRLPENSSEIVVPQEFNEIRQLNDVEIVSVGDRVTIKMLTYIRGAYADDNLEGEDAYAEEFGIEYREFEREFTVVGIMEDRNYSAKDPESSYFPVILTVSDGNEGEVLWHNLYAKTYLPGQADDLAEKGYGGEAHLFRDLLDAYGFTLAEEENQFILIAAILMVGVVLIASINPIRNAFSISVTERTLQFGLLSSIGTTKKQVRSSVLFEAGIVAAVGIPVGVMLGYGAVCLLFGFSRNRIAQAYQTIFSEMASKAITVELPDVTLNWVVVIITVLICAVTIMISARIPAKRATKVMPIEAIRQQRDIRVSNKQIRVKEKTGRLFGLPGVLAKKYYKTSRSKYRTTVASISVGMVLFIGVNYIGETCKMVLDFGYPSDYDLEYEVSSPEKILSELEYAKNLPGVDIAVALYELGAQETCVPYDTYTDGYKECKEIQESSENGGHKTTAALFYLEDEYFAECLRKEGIDPTPYLTASDPTAVTVEMNHRHWVGRDENGETIWYKYYGSWLKTDGELYLSRDAETDSRILYDHSWNELPEIQNGTMSSVIGEYRKDAKGKTILEYSATRFLSEGKGEEVILAAYLVEYDVNIAEEKLISNYYTYDCQTGRKGELVLSESKDAMTVRAGGTLSAVPFGVGDQGYSALIMPMSQMPDEWKADESAVIRIDANDYFSCVNELNRRGELESEFRYTDHVKEKYQVYMMVDMIQNIINGLIVMISLISAINIFNTITANIALRRRDFGMLRSIGMADKDINRMMGFECISCGTKALGISLPLGLAVCGITYLCIYRYYHTGVGFPWLTVCLGSLMVFLIVFASAFYAVAKLRKDNPIDAIRMDNL